MIEKGGRNKLAAALGVSGPYLGRVLSGKKADDPGADCEA
jgi:hypothetical protein